MRPLLFCLLAVLGTSAVAQNLPDVRGVADKIGQQIEFQDEIKAISYSRSTEGYYLSFGAPYPDQVLSVWVSRDLYDHLPATQKLVGRLVRIKGLVQKSPTGPLMTLNSRDQFTLLQADESVLGDPLLDGKQDRDQFMAAVWQTFRRGEFEKLETLAKELRQSRERFSDGLWLSDAFFSAFDVGEKTDRERFASIEQTIARWEAARPGSIVTPIIKAGFHKDLAWKSRGNDSGSKVTPEGRESFKRELAIARDILEKHPASRIHPEYLAVMQSIAIGQFWTKEEFMRLFAEATAVERDYYTFYFNTAHFLLPRWRGRKGEWEQFAEEQRQARGAGGEGDALYARIAWSLRPYYHHMFRDTAISWEVMASGLEYLVRQYPQSHYTKNAYAYFAWKARDRERLRKALPEIRDHLDMTFWANLETVAFAEKFARDGATR
jgi:hypothetical protein